MVEGGGAAGGGGDEDSIAVQNSIDLELANTDNSNNKEKSSGAKKKRFQTSRLQRQVSGIDDSQLASISALFSTKMTQLPLFTFSQRPT